MNLLLATAGVLVLALAGVGILRLGWPAIVGASWPVRLALGFCAGTFLIGFVLFGAYLAGLSFSHWVVLGPVGAFAVSGVWGLRRSGRKTLTGEKPWLAGLLVALALALSWARPVYGYDAVMMWALKAKITFFARTWPATMFDPFSTAHTEYPPVVPSAQAFIYFWLGEFDDVASRVVFAAWFAAGAVIFWWWLTQWRVSGRSVWLLWWCALPLAMEQVKITYADLPLAVYLLIFYGAVVTWLREPVRREWLWLAAILGGMAFWVKQDALLGVGAGFVTLLFLRRPAWRSVVVAGLIAGAIAAPWRVFVWVQNLPSDFAVSWANMSAKTGVIAQELFNFAVLEGGFAFFWPLVIVALLFRVWRKWRVETTWLTVALAANVLAVFVVYWCSTPDLLKLLKSSIERVLLSLFVPALLVVAVSWRGRFRAVRWQLGLFVGSVVLTVVMFGMGMRQRSDEELFGLSISPFPAALSWMWLVVGLLTTWWCVPLVRRHGQFAIERTVQWAVMLATLGLALVSIGVQARSVGELWRQFGGKTLAEQHGLAMEPALRDQISRALNIYPPGLHVNVLPKRSLLRHRFYYETYPDLIVDGAATTVIQLANE